MLITGSKQLYRMCHKLTLKNLFWCKKLIFHAWKKVKNFPWERRKFSLDRASSYKKKFFRWDKINCVCVCICVCVCVKRRNMKKIVWVRSEYIVSEKSKALMRMIHTIGVFILHISLLLSSIHHTQSRTNALCEQRDFSLRDAFFIFLYYLASL